jgi:MSHA biogenesis protein MshQ
VLRRRLHPLVLLCLLLAAAGRAHAGATVNAITLNGAAPPVSVDGGTTIAVSLTVTTTGTGSNGRWRSTGYIIGGAGEICIDVPNPNNAENAGTYTRTFNIQAPATNGTYDFSVNIYGGDGCGNANGSATSAGAIIVSDPVVTSIARAASSPTNASSVSWTVTFNRPVTGVDATDFSLAVSGLTGTSITGVSGSGSSYTVTANTGTGSGTLGLNLVDNDSITDASSFKLGGNGIGNGNFTGQVYSVDRTAPTVTKSFSPSTIAINGTSTLTITIANNQATAIAGVAFTDSYPGGGALKNAATPGLTNSCGGTATAAANATSLALTGASVAASSSCSVSVTVTATATGSYGNSTGSVTATNATTSSGASATLTVGAAVSSFNAVEPAAAAASGKIFTKIAGQDFSLDIVALDASNAVATGFAGTVSVEVVDNSGGGACGALPVIATFSNQTFVAGDAGRHALSAGNSVGNVYRNARIRIRYPAGAPTVTSCSGDNFAVRPGSLGVSVTHANRTTEGTTASLNNTALSGAVVHNAGRPFRITVTAYRADGTTITTNYDGSPTIAGLAACGGTACTASFGTLGLGTWAAGGGVVTSTTASYDDVGAFNLQLQDTGYAAVDSADGSSYVVPAAAIGVGRFVPDQFVLSATSSTPRSDIAACSTSVFTYLSEQLTAGFTLTAVNAAGNATTRYAGSLARLDLSTGASFGFKAVDAAAPTPLTSRINASLTPAVLPSWTNGVAVVAWPIAVQRLAAPDGPFSAVKIGIAPSDPDSVTLAAAALNVDSDNDTVADSAQVGSTTALRFGRLRVLDAAGSAKASLSVRMRTEYWSGSMFVVNPQDSCTSLTRASVAMVFQGLGTCTTQLPAGSIGFSSGVASPSLSAPGAAGSADLRVNLSASSGSACTPASTGAGNAAFPYLQGRWTSAGTYTDDPVARATFGVFGQDRLPNSVIFRRENF